MSRGLVDYHRLVETVAAEAEVLATAAEGQRPERQVPACPGLNLGETARHVGSTFRMVAAWVRDGRQPTTWQQDPVAGQTLSDYVRDGVGPLVDVLSERAADDPCQTWWPAERTCRFWARRLAHEATVHRMDVQSAAGLPLDPVPDDVAEDGADEVLTLWLGHRLDVLGVRGTREGAVAIRAGRRAWIARTGPEPATAWEVSPEEADSADADVAGSPMAVYRWLWGRIPDREVTTNGDHDAIAQLWALLRLATK
ncbi:maleylpyruvate isomerase N-terminal domain-containing protein [Saccharothrix obliqua]|uniref:maleylpyruvate isomerase N-terminal domain-containing protein n=1 Tax=Saccharothrix obliqua TaxID=2861747 RepID=UPI001C5E6C51|nr:maleylpyruvate isomerase N-terminal domain-containing protein [Saccharothrix obliqua]MBW4721630.1 maleylpyruvate isomerase N-terminal domain-containing protein [Saccharothrix obliqua]